MKKICFLIAVAVR